MTRAAKSSAAYQSPLFGHRKKGKVNKAVKTVEAVEVVKVVRAMKMRKVVFGSSARIEGMKLDQRQDENACLTRGNRSRREAGRERAEAVRG